MMCSMDGQRGPANRKKYVNHVFLDNLKRVCWDYENQIDKKLNLMLNLIFFIFYIGIFHS